MRHAAWPGVNSCPLLGLQLGPSRAWASTTPNRRAFQSRGPVTVDPPCRSRSRDPEVPWVDTFGEPPDVPEFVKHCCNTAVAGKVTCSLDQLQKFGPIVYVGLVCRFFERHELEVEPFCRRRSKMDAWGTGVPMHRQEPLRHP